MWDFMTWDNKNPTSRPQNNWAYYMSTKKQYAEVDSIVT